MWAPLSVSLAHSNLILQTPRDDWVVSSLDLSCACQKHPSGNMTFNTLSPTSITPSLLPLLSSSHPSSISLPLPPCLFLPSSPFLSLPLPSSPCLSLSRSPLQYSVRVVKYDRKGFRPRPRLLLLTHAALYVVEEAKVKQRVEYNTLKGHHLSSAIRAHSVCVCVCVCTCMYGICAFVYAVYVRSCNVCVPVCIRVRECSA